MTTNLLANGTDLDSVFAAYAGGTKKAATGYQVAGIDLADRFAPIEQGSAAAATGMRVAGADLNTLFAAIGSLVHPLAGLDGKALSVTDGQTSDTDHVMSATVGVHLNNIGGWSVDGRSDGSGPVTQPAPTSGTWMPSGAASDYEAQFDVLSQFGDAGYQLINDAPAWANLGTTRNLTLSIPVGMGSSPNQYGAEADVRIRIRRASTGAVFTDNTISMSVATNGYVVF